VVVDEQALRTEMHEALHNETCVAARAALCRALGPSFRQVSQVIWIGGSIIGPDRANGRSPFKAGSDATVGLAIVAQVAGELIVGAVSLLDSNNNYAAVALIRQLVEVEYLAWAFAEDQAEAEAWMRASRSERQSMWQPRHLRERSGGKFRGSDYGWHCEQGGHPPPHARKLLPGHTARVPEQWWWYELAAHGRSTWTYLSSAADRLGLDPCVDDIAANTGFANASDRWYATDRLRPLAANLPAGLM